MGLAQKAVQVHIVKDPDSPDRNGRNEALDNYFDHWRTAFRRCYCQRSGLRAGRLIFN